MAKKDEFELLIRRLINKYTNHIIREGTYLDTEEKKRLKIAFVGGMLTHAKLLQDEEVIKVYQKIFNSYEPK